MSTTVLPSKDFKTASLDTEWRSFMLPRSFRDVESDETPLKEIPRGPYVRLEVQELDFETLVARLVELEQRGGFSSVEMFSQYVQGGLDLNEQTKAWLGLFVLFLGSNEIRRYSCP